MIKIFSLPTLQKKIVFSTVVQYGGKIINMAISIVMLKMISGFLDINDYGIYAKITEYALFFSVVANLGIFGNTIRQMADNPKDGRIFVNALIVRVVSAGIFFAIGGGILLLNTNDRIFVIGSLLFFGTLFFDYITSVCDAALQSQYLMGRATVALVLGKITALSCLWILIENFYQSGDQFPLIFGFFPTLAGSVVTAALSLYFVRRAVNWSYEIHLVLMRNLLLSALPFGIINIINSAYFRFIPDYLAGNQALTNAQFATFNISFKIAQVVSLFSTFLMFSVLPGLKEYIDGKKWDLVQKLNKKITIVLIAGGLLVFILGSFFSPLLLEFLTHKKYFLSEFWFVLPMMLLLAAVSYGYDLMLIGLFALEKEIWLLKREGIALALAVLISAGLFFVNTPEAKIFFILLGALTAEIFIVIFGLKKFWREIYKIKESV